VVAAGEQAAARAKPIPKAQANFTDPESRIMETVTPPTSRRTTARPSSTTPTRSSRCRRHRLRLGPPQLHPDARADAANTASYPEQALVDAGYCSEDNLHTAAARQAEHATTTFMATGRLGHDQQVPPAPRGRIPNHATPVDRCSRASCGADAVIGL
jgi:hypothetical protein